MFVSFKIERKAFQTRNLLFFQSRHIYNFSKPMVLAEKSKFYFSCSLVKMDLEVVFLFVLDRKKGFPDYKNVVFRESPYLWFFLQNFKKSRKELSSTSTNVNFTFISRHNIYNIIMENFGCFLLCKSFRNFWNFGREIRLCSAWKFSAKFVRLQR